MVLKGIKPLYVCFDLEKLDKGGKTVLENLFSEQSCAVNQEIWIVF